MRQAEPHAPVQLLGVGIDLASVELVEQAINNFGERYVQKVFTGTELRYCQGRSDRAQLLAAAFAAKEAAMKALGAVPPPPWTCIELDRAGGGTPRLRLRGVAAEAAAALGADQLHVSVSHTAQSAFAAVVATTGLS